jgi:hypothetical protein
MLVFGHIHPLASPSEVQLEIYLGPRSLKIRGGGRIPVDLF